MNMGINTIDAVLDIQVTPAQKAVLFMLAYHNNDKTNVCMPSVAIMAKETCLTERAVFSTLKSLEAMGYIRRERRTNEKGKYISSQFVLVLPDSATLVGDGAPDSDTYLNHVQGVSAPDSDTVSEPRSPSLEQKYNKNMEQEERRRATRLPADWQPSPEDISFCQKARPDLNVRDVADSFRDYWTARSGKEATKLDWPATWRNWVRREKARPSRPSQKTSLEEAIAARHAESDRMVIDVNAKEVSYEQISY